MHRHNKIFRYCLSLALLATTTAAQQPEIRIQSNLVVVPALVRNEEGNLVYSLTADDFIVRDNGTDQKIHLETDRDPHPLALVVAIQTAGNGARQEKYINGLSTMIENIAGNTPQTVALVAFGNKPALAADFSKDPAIIREKLKYPPSLGSGSAILDAVAFSLNLLRQQPEQYRKAILLVSETRDHGSKAKHEEIVQQIARSNTAVYSVAFSPAATQFKDALTGPGQPHKAISINPMLPESAGYFELTPLILMAINGMRANSAEEMATLSGGEYTFFNNKHEFDQDLNAIANHLPNRYLLSFQPSSSQSGLHSIDVRLKNHPKWNVTARTSYWSLAETE
jgi:VWFA-related protein